MRGKYLWLTLCLLMACSSGYASGVVSLDDVFTGLRFDKPLAIRQAPGNDLSWYVAEQPGRIMRIRRDNQQFATTVFADIRARVNDGPNEAGLLGMAFDPQFVRNGRVYLSYTRDNGGLESVLSRFLSKDGGATLDTDSEQVLLTVRQPYGNHNGGNILFGADGYLYFGLGDGGSGGDPQGNGQNLQTLLGSLLRLDVSGDAGYSIPPDNPFANGAGRPEIYAYGLRNPWRWSFDRKTGDLWLADVGQDKWEEVNRIMAGGNYGWNRREGRHCYKGDCNQQGLIDPLTEYSHDDGCSITGGYVYRGEAIPKLKGMYLYGDFCTGNIWTYPADETGHSEILLKTSLNITSFGEGNLGELYVVDRGGRIFQLVKN